MIPPKPTKRDSSEFIKIVKNKFQNERETYYNFLRILEAYKTHRISFHEVRSMVKKLFKKHPELIRGFNKFLPKSFQITLDDDQTPSTKSILLGEANCYLTKVKTKFEDDDPRYTSFIEVFEAFMDQRLDSNIVKPIVKELFKEHPELIWGFNIFLPKGSEITLDGDQTASTNAVVLVEALDFLTKVKTRFQDDDSKCIAFFDILEMYRKKEKCAVEMSILFRGHSDLLVEFSKFLPSD